MIGFVESVDIRTPAGKGSSVAGEFETHSAVLPLPAGAHPGLYNKYAVAEEISKAAPERKLTGRVLVVEDNPANQALMSLLLKKKGLAVEVAADGVEGVEKASRQGFDLILMDMQMPRMNGYDATRHLRKDGITLPIIAVTANAMKGDEEKCLNSGCTAYLSKPVDKTKMYRMLENYLLPGAGESPMPSAEKRGNL